MYEVSSNLAINLTATGIDEISQNIRTILSSYELNCPMMRGFGVDSNVIDANPLQVQARLMADIADKIEQFEPRAIVNRIRFEDTQNGFKPLVTFSIREEG